MSRHHVDRAARGESNLRVRITVEGSQALLHTYAENLSAGGMFVRDDKPPAKGSNVLVEFVLPSGDIVARVAAEVAHARKADTAGVEKAGMGLSFVGYDDVAKMVVGSYRQAHPTREHRQPTPTLAKVENLTPSPESRRDGPIVGIDLGTTNSCVAIVKDGQPQILVSPQGYETVPSAIFVTPQRTIKVGSRAVEQLMMDPTRTVYSAKRFIGRPFKSHEVNTFGHFFHYELAAGKEGRTAAKIGDMIVPLEVSAGYVLWYLRGMAERELGREVRACVVTVPAYFSAVQRASIRDAAELAGMEVVRLLSEPTAAAVAFGYRRGVKKTVLVYDIGGGTFDASILRIRDHTMDVLATDGDPFLGGSDFDDRLIEHVVAHAEREHRVPIRHNLVAMERIRFACEFAKRHLSQSETARIDVPYLVQGKTSMLGVALDVTRETFEAMTEDLIVRTLQRVDSVLERAKLSAEDIDEVLLVGGQSRSPHIRRLLEERFQKKPSKSVHPDHAVALGAAVVASAHHGTETQIELTDVLSQPIVSVAADGSIREFFKQGTRLPNQLQFQVDTTEGGSDGFQFDVPLYRGTGTDVRRFEFLGRLRLPSGAAFALTGQQAEVSLKLTEDGLLQGQMVRPVDGKTYSLEVAVERPPNDDLVEIDALDVVEVEV